LSNVTALPPEDDRMGPPDAGFILDTYLRHQRVFRDSERDVRRAAAGQMQESWYASSLASCYRVQYMQRLGVERLRALDEQALRTFAWGDTVEDFLRRVYQRCGLVEQTQVRLESGSLVARGDLLLRYPPQDVADIPDDVRSEWSPEWIAFLEKLRVEISIHAFSGLVASEIKSTHSRAMKFLFKEGKPRESHSMQVGASIALTELVPDAPKPDFWQVEYMGKDAVGLLRFRVGDEWAEKATERWNHLDDIWAAQPDPKDVPCECKGWMVTYCAYNAGDGSCCGNGWDPEANGLAKTAGDPF
jgi:hypothetical protein